MAQAPIAVVFGGTGFIGTHATLRLANRGWRVISADVMPPRLSHPRVDVRRCDVRHPIGLEAQRPDLVLNLAAVHRTPGHPDSEYYDTNVAGALNVTGWASRVGARHLIFTSSIAVYGSAEESLDEGAELRPTSSYGKSKLLAEGIHESWLEHSSDNRLTIVRPAAIFGPGENGNFSRLARQLAKRRFAFPGRSDTVKACGYVEDLLDAFDLSVQSPDRMLTFNFAYPEPYTISDVVNAFATVAGYRQPGSVPRPIVDQALRVLLRPSAVPARGRYLGERIQKLTRSTFIVPGFLSQAGFKWRTDLVSAFEEWFRACGRKEFS